MRIIDKDLLSLIANIRRETTRIELELMDLERDSLTDIKLELQSAHSKLSSLDFTGD